MVTEKIATVEGGLPTPAAPSVGDVVATFLKKRKPNTREAYRVDLAAFQEYIGASSPGDAVKHLIEIGKGAARMLVENYQADLRERGLSPATINRRVATLRSLVKFFRAADVITWALDIEGLPAEPYRDTRGPGLTAFNAAITYLKARKGPKAIRDVAIFYLLGPPQGFRRGEIAALDVADLDVDEGTVNVIGKGKLEAKAYGLGPVTLEALRRWLAVRGDAPGPLFVNFDRAGAVKAGRGARLTAGGVYKVVTAIGKGIGVRITPHGLRHTAITEAARVMGFSGAVKLGRHARAETTQRYVDNLRDGYGDVARALSAVVA